ncbi:MAG TPA: lysophospholipid acyltransferase family protein [Polyangiaceae bacterium]|nr:lysophospholipid acyltransferase family protein [Polyangiaceae bacterium]
MHAEEAIEAKRSARDRRFGERWTRAQALKNRLVRRMLGAVLFFVDLLPAAALLPIGALVGRLSHAVLANLRHAARERIAASIPGVCANAVARACFENAGKNLALCSLLRRRGTRAKDFVALSDESRAVLEQALAAGRGALVVSAHLGPFEMIPALLVEHGFSPSIVVRESYDPELDPVVDAHRRGRGIEVIHRGHDHAALQIARSLRRGRPVGVLPDVGSRGVATAPARFLGRAVAFPVGVERLATRLGCPVVIGTLTTTTRGTCPGFELRIEALTTDMDAGVALTQRVADAVSHAIARCPEHWLWMAPAHLAIADDSPLSLFSGVTLSSELGPA